MELSNDIVSQFAKLTSSNKTEEKETVVYGTIVISDGKKYVRLDGSNIDTPVSSTTSAKNGDRVMVTIKNHEAIVTGNITSPSPSQDDMDELEENVETKISEFDIIVADKVSTEYLEANYLRAEEIRAEFVRVEELEADFVSTEELEAEYIKADEIDAKYAKISTLESDYITAEQISAKYASVENLEATNVEVRTIKADYVKAEELNAIKGNIEELETKKLDTESAEILYANVDFTNINEASVVKIFSESGIIKDLVVSEGTITGELVGVTIKGDLIEGNTVKADKLVVKGSDGLYYKLNFEGGTFKEGEAVPDDGLHGSVIVAESITAEKISVDDLVAFGATIGGFHISTNSLYSGVKSSATNTTRGVFLGDDGQFATGDSTNFIRYFKDQNGNYKLEVTAASIKLGGSDKSVEEIVKDAEDAAKEAYNKAQNAQDSVDDMEIGGRNYLQKTDIRTYHGEWISYSLKSTLSMTEDEYLKITPNSNVNYDGAYPPKISKLENNTEYTLSFEAYADANITLNYCYIMCAAGNKSLNAHIPITTTPSKYTLTFTTDKAYENCSIMLAYTDPDAYVTTPFYVRRLCVDKGNKASDWTAAPEDVDEKIYNVQDNVNEVESRVGTAELNIDSINNTIGSLVTDANGNSLMVQTGSGWAFNMGTILADLEEAATLIGELSQKNSSVTDLANKLDTVIKGVLDKTAYVLIGEDEGGNPCVLLGDQESDFKVRITNTAVDFMEGTSRIAYINNKTLYIEKAIIKTELHIGEGSGFVIAKRANGNVGFRWKESD